MHIRGLSCIFPAADIRITADFYVSKLGFRAVEYLQCAQPHICLYRDDAEVILLQANTKTIRPNRALYGYGYDAYFYTADQEALEQEYLSRDVRIITRLNTTDYQNKEFVIEDPDGRHLAFGLKLKD